MKSRVAIVLLAAGMARRMGVGSVHKLLARFDGVPLVRRTAMIALASHATSVTVVVGDREPAIREAIKGLPLAVVSNTKYASGIASSVKVGFGAAVTDEMDGILVMLADMPGVTTADLNRLISAFHDAASNSIIRAAAHGKAGNPVILPTALSGAVARLEGDVGARDIIRESGTPVIDVEIGDAAALDVDTPEAVLAAGGVL